MISAAFPKRRPISSWNSSPVPKMSSIEKGSAVNPAGRPAWRISSATSPSRSVKVSKSFAAVRWSSSSTDSSKPGASRNTRSRPLEAVAASRSRSPLRSCWATPPTSSGRLSKAAE